MAESKWGELHWRIHVDEGKHSLLQHLDVHLATYPIKKYQFSAFQQMYPMDSNVSLYNLHTICYSSQLKEPLIHGAEDKRRHSILHVVL